MQGFSRENSKKVQRQNNQTNRYRWTYPVKVHKEGKDGCIFMSEQYEKEEKQTKKQRGREQQRVTTTCYLVVKRQYHTTRFSLQWRAITLKVLPAWNRFSRTKSTTSGTSWHQRHGDQTGITDSDITGNAACRTFLTELILNTAESQQKLIAAMLDSLMLRFIYLASGCRDSRKRLLKPPAGSCEDWGVWRGLPSRTSHSRSLSGREDCGGRDLWISGVGLGEKKREEEALQWWIILRQQPLGGVSQVWALTKALVLQNQITLSYIAATYVKTSLMRYRRVNVFVLPLKAAIGFHSFPYDMKIWLQTLDTCLTSSMEIIVWILIRVTLSRWCNATQTFRIILHLNCIITII